MLIQTSLGVMEKPEKQKAKAATVDEATIKRQIMTVLSPYFEIRTEVVGRHPYYSERPKIDFWCYPKEKALAMGWPAEWFGIEAKSKGLQDQRGKATVRLLKQAEIYRESVFPTPDGERQPHFVLVCPTFAEIIRREDYSLNPGDNPLVDEGFATALGRHAGLSRVGELQLLFDGFQVFFNCLNRQFSTRWGWARVNYISAETGRASR